MTGWITRLRDAVGRGPARDASLPDPAAPTAPAAAAVEPSTATVFDPMDPAFIADPYPFFAYLREQDPVHRAPSGAWVLTRYEDVRAALGDPRLGNAPAPHAVLSPRHRQRHVCADVAANIVPFLDPPHHAAPRRVVARAFHDILRRRPPDVRAMADGLLSTWRPGEPRDVVADFGSPLAVSVISSLIGIPAADAPELEAWSESFFYLFTAIPSTDILRRVDEDLGACRTYLTDLLRRRRRDARDDLLSALATAEAPELSDEARVDHAMLLFADGVENVDRAIGNAVHTLLVRPDALAAAKAAPEGIDTAVDECLRFESPGQFIGRVARAPLELHGTAIPAGATVLLVLGSANRDASVFQDAERFDPLRRPNPHLAFGQGRHACIGGPLVEMEVRAALQALFARFPGLSPTSDPVRWLPRAGHRWVDRVMVDPGRLNPTGGR